MDNAPQYVIEMLHITKEFNGVKANDDITLQLKKGEIHALLGENGAGKTTLIREIAAQLGATDTVTSPTFAIVNQYKGKGGRRIHHFDFYRINDVREAYDLGYEEYFY